MSVSYQQYNTNIICRYDTSCSNWYLKLWSSYIHFFVLAINLINKVNLKGQIEEHNNKNSETPLD